MTNQIIHGDAHTQLKKIPDQTIHLTIFSPPYDQLRDYHGYTLNLNQLGTQLYRITKPGGIVIIILQDQTINGHKTLTTFRTILHWCDHIGFKLFECNIYQKQGKDGAWWKNRFRVDHEYIPIFLKGKRPHTFNKNHIKIPSKHAGKTMRGGANRNKNGITQPTNKITINPTKCPGTIWNYTNGGDKIYLKNQHPATFPDKIPYDLIQTFTQPGHTVLDPMVGSGSTAIAAHILNRNYIAIDISKQYCQLTQQRIQQNQTNLLHNFKNTTKRKNNHKQKPHPTLL